ncbi:MAG TPA: cupin-like domain-containing protein, partial [Sphingomicrobium sp.]|nr:cupin-like domain-containing protein [Sphingomicrobium sp.]
MAEWRDVDFAVFRNEIATRNQPAVLRGAVAHWPAVAAGKQSAAATATYLSQFDRGAEVRAFIAPSEVAGRYFYNPAVDGFNFGVTKTTLSKLVATLAAMPAAEHRSIYMGSTPTAAILPGFAGDNFLELVAGKPTEPRIWIGNDS